ncbi:MAG: PQQ-dependent sugar dehydrogenase, partial [Actinomycetota bacterium]
MRFLLPARAATAMVLALVTACGEEVTSPPGEIELALETIATGLQFPLLVTAPLSDPSRLFVVEKGGIVRVIRNGSLLPTPFLDIRAKVSTGAEQGLLGLAFHPDHAVNGWLFVYHTNSTGASNVLARYSRSATDPGVADPTSRMVVITFSHTLASVHNGGMIAFGPDDGHLYIATGDGGTFCDMPDNAQSGTSNLGKLLRIDVDSGDPYGIPPDNPFARGGGRPEVFATGLRNPWRFSFDRTTGELWAGDVGQSSWEEVDVVRRGGNYGWRIMEGTHCYQPRTGCATEGLERPVLEYRNGGGRCSVIG